MTPLTNYRVLYKRYAHLLRIHLLLISFLQQSSQIKQVSRVILHNTKLDIGLIFYTDIPFVCHPQSETLLHLAVVCRKLETEQERVLPFYTLSLNAEELSQEKAHAVEVSLKS